MTAPRGTIGASDVAALFNESPYASRFSLFARECGLLAHLEDTTSERNQMGLDLEWPILEIWAKRAGQKIAKGSSIKRDDLPGISATPDAFILTGYDDESGEPADAKTVQPHARRDWDAGAPRHYWWQSQQQILCASAERGWMVPLFGVNELGGVCIEADRVAQEKIVREVALFWKQVRGEAPPPTADEHRATIAAMMERRRERKAMDFGDPRIADMVAAIDAEYVAARAERLAAEKREERAKAAILAALGDCDLGTFADGSGYRVDVTKKTIKAKEATTQIQRKLTRFVGTNTEEGIEE